MESKVLNSEKRSFIRTQIDLQRAVPYIILALLAIVLSVSNSNFLQISTFRNLFQSVSATGIVAVGAMLVLITGGIDFTTQYGLSVAAVSVGSLYVYFGQNVWALVITGILVGGLIGVVNGFIISKFHMPPFIVTLAMMSILQGLALMISEGKQILIKEPETLFIGQGVLFGWLPIPFIIFLVVSFVGYIILNRTKMGVYIYTMGGNENAAIYAGVNVDFYKFLVYVFAGFCTGIAAVVTCSRVAMVSSSLASDILMDGISSAVIGGTSSSGGKGTVGGMIAGVLIMGLITTALTYLNVDTLLRDVVKGVVIIAALLIDSIVNKTSQK